MTLWASEPRVLGKQPGHSALPVRDVCVDGRRRAGLGRWAPRAVPGPSGATEA